MLSPERKGCITASEIGAIAGNGRFATRADVMRRKVREANGLPSEFVGNIATEWGHEHEADAVAQFEFETGETIDATGENQKFVKTEIQSGDGTLILAGATPDGLLRDTGLLEVKCPYGKRNEKPAAVGYLASAPEYMDQMQWQMLVTGRHHCVFAVWTPHGLDYITISAHYQRQEELVAIAMEFQRELNEILADEEKQIPYLQDRDHVREDAEFSALAEAYKLAMIRLEVAQAAADEAKAALLSACTDSVKGCGLQIIKAERKGAIDYAKVPELKGIDLEKYRKKSSTVWTVKEWTQ